MKIVCFDISKLTKEQFYFLYNNSTDERKKKAEKYRIEEDKIRCIVGGKLLEYSLNNWLYNQNKNHRCVENPHNINSRLNQKNVEADSTNNSYFINSDKKNILSLLETQNRKNGKPFLKNVKNFHFNISHSGKWVVIGYDSDELGIDIEKINESKIEAQKKLAERYFTKNEINYIFQNEYGFSKRFTEIWTGKEAYLKYSGKGISCNLSSVDTTKIAGLFRISFEKDYFLSVYSENYFGNFSDNMEIISFESLC